MLAKKLAAILHIYCMLLFLTACNIMPNNTQPDTYISFTDSCDNIVTLYKKPENTAVLFSSFADVWVNAGGKVNITVGEAVERGFADNDAVLVDKSAGKSIDIETLISAKPDLVIGSADVPAHVSTAETLKAAGIPCALFHVECFDDYLDVLKICTDITGDSDAYIKSGTDVKAGIDKILDGIDAKQEQKRILFIRSGSGASSAKAKTADEHFAAKMLEELGAYNIADNAPVLLDGLSIEEIMREDPDIIFISTMGDEAAAKAYMESVLETKEWQSLSAVSEDRVYYLPKELFQFKPNAKWDDAYAYLKDILYAEE